MAELKECVFIDGIRTPNARAHAEKGWFREVRPDELLTSIYTALFERNQKVKPEDVDLLFVGSANLSGMQNDIARLAWLASGLPESVPSQSVSNQCPSGMSATMDAARAVMTGECDIVIAAGAEEFPYAKRDIDNMNADRVAVDAFILRASQVITVAPPQRVVFLFGTEDFQRELWRKGGWYKNYVGVCRSPEQATETFIEANIRQSRMLQAEAKELGCQIVITGGVKSVEKVLEEIGRLPGFLSPAAKPTPI